MWPHGPAPPATAGWRGGSREPSSDRERTGEGHVLLPIEQAELEARLARGLLQRGPGGRQLLERPGGHRDVPREAVLRMAVGQLHVTLLDALLLSGVAGGDQEPTPPSKLAVSQIRGPGLGDLAGGAARAH